MVPEEITVRIMCDVNGLSRQRNSVIMNTHFPNRYKRDRSMYAPRSDWINYLEGEVAKWQRYIDAVEHCGEFITKVEAIKLTKLSRFRVKQVFDQLPTPYRSQGAKTSEYREHMKVRRNRWRDKLSQLNNAINSPV